MPPSGHCSYAAFEQKLQELRVLPLMHGVWAARSSLSAAQLRQELRTTLEETDRILVIEVAGDCASRRAENNLAELIPPRGGPALFLWEKRWGKE